MGNSESSLHRLLWPALSQSPVRGCGQPPLRTSGQRQWPRTSRLSCCGKDTFVMMRQTMAPRPTTLWAGFGGQAVSTIRLGMGEILLSMVPLTGDTP